MYSVYKTYVQVVELIKRPSLTLFKALHVSLLMQLRQIVRQRDDDWLHTRLRGWAGCPVLHRGGLAYVSCSARARRSNAVQRTDCPVAPLHRCTVAHSIDHARPSSTKFQFKQTQGWDGYKSVIFFILYFYPTYASMYFLWLRNLQQEIKVETDRQRKIDKRVV